jgi:hypothetical protein
MVGHGFRKTGLGAFVDELVSSPGRFMWFLGAGASRGSGMPSADDLIWRLKFRYYRQEENAALRGQDSNNAAIRRQVQDYCDGRGFPGAGQNEEYSFYFELLFGSDIAKQQAFVQDAVSPANVDLSVGARAFAALIELGAAPVTFTTNFDDVVEQALAEVAGKSIAPYHLEGSYAALDALNQSRLPIYAKLHGDFRYRSIKNLSADLLSNDAEIQRSFLTASGRYGVVVCGYSGRDNNVMSMFREALKGPNPFPAGLVWTCTRSADVSERVTDFLAEAAAAGVNTSLCEVGTFDIMMSRVWRQWPTKTDALIKRVKAWSGERPNVPMPPPGKRYPLLRTNAFEITRLPQTCGLLSGVPGLDGRVLKDRLWEERPDLIAAYDGEGYFWGNNDDVRKLFPLASQLNTVSHTFADPVAELERSPVMRGFFEQGIARALSETSGLLLRKRKHTHYLVVPHSEVSSSRFKTLRSSVGYRGSEANITGVVPKLRDVTWAEAISIRLERRNGQSWLMIRPEIWIKPLSAREQAFDFLSSKRKTRYNPQSNAILDAWVELLLNGQSRTEEVAGKGFAAADHRIEFSFNPRSAIARLS